MVQLADLAKHYWLIDMTICQFFAARLGTVLTGDTRKIFVSKTVDESHSARVLIGCKPIRHSNASHSNASRYNIIGCAVRSSSASRYKFDGCYSSKFHRSSARRFLLEILARGKRYDQ